MMAIFERERAHGHTLNSPQSHSRTHRRNRVFLLGVQVFLKVGKAKYLVSSQIFVVQTQILAPLKDIYFVPYKFKSTNIPPAVGVEIFNT